MSAEEIYLICNELEIDEKAKHAALTPEGIEKAEEYFFSDLLVTKEKYDLIKEIENRLNNHELYIVDLPEQYNCIYATDTWDIVWPPTAHIKISKEERI